MWTSSPLRRPRRLSRLALALALGLPSSWLTASSVGAQTQPAPPTIQRIAGSLSWGTVLPGQAPVVVVPWTSGGFVARTAPVFQITGAANQTVYLKPLALPNTIANGTGDVVQVMAYTLSYNTLLSSMGAIALQCVVGQEVSVTLNASGIGYVSLGATLLTTASQGKGSYVFAEGALLQVR